MIEPPAKTQRIVCSVIAITILLPWYAIAVPWTIMVATAEWIVFEVDPWLQNKMYPMQNAIVNFAWRIGRRAVGYKPNGD